MNMGLVISTVIGGILLIAILSLNLQVSQSSSTSTLDQITKTNLDNVAQVVTNDFTKVGYNATSPMITAAGPHSITFQSDIDNDGVVDVVNWTLTATGVSSTDNPNDYVLQRTVGTDITSITSGVTKFDLTYYDQNQQVTTVLTDIKSIKVDLECQSAVAVDNEYIKTSWHKLYVPWNLQN